jgi:MFS family permease
MNRQAIVLCLGTAQTLAWASTYYLPAVLAAPMARELGISTPQVFGAFSLALVVSAAMGPWAGRLIDRRGGRGLLMATSGLFALGLLLLRHSEATWQLWLAWAVLGLGMGCGLYEAAFASLVRLHGLDARRSITGITLLAGFASTIGWPLSAWMESQWGWRDACLGWALLHLGLGLPLNALLPGVTRETGSSGQVPLAGVPHIDAVSATQGPPQAVDPQPGRPPAWTAPALAYVFAVTWFISTALATHLPAMLQAAGATAAGAIAVGALIGPAQVAARLLEFGVLGRFHPLLSARLATLGHPAGAALVLALGPMAAPAFAVLHGAGNGILTIAKGTLPLALFGQQGYGTRQGWLVMPSRVAQAAAPFVFGIALERLGQGALWLSFSLGLSGFGCLMLLRAPARGR